MTTEKLHHFYHIFADGVWEPACEYHLEALRISGLQAELSTFQIGIVGGEHNRMRVRHFFDSRRINYFVCAESLAGWEQVTQHALHEFASNSGLVLYAHTKGASRFARDNNAWRRVMTEYTVMQWRSATSYLDRHDAVGCYWTGQIFAGTFWWTWLRHIRMLEKPSISDRYQAEAWIGQIKNASMLDLRSPQTQAVSMEEQGRQIDADCANAVEGPLFDSRVRVQRGRSIGSFRVI